MKDKNISSSKRKASRAKYEKKTLHKVCTLRAPIAKHDLIKAFATSGKCDRCDNNYNKYVRSIKYWKAQLNSYRNNPSWSDEFSRRDGYLAFYCFTFAYFFYLANIFIEKLVF